MKQTVEVCARRGSVRQREEPFHAIPKRVRIQHETRARHDVGPIAGLVLLEQMEALMLLSAEPLESQRYLAPVTAQQAAPALREPLVEQRERDEPPQRRIDAPQIPKIGFAP